jgi:uncharacterized membrane protein YphA (DoxX/SURF4 family)
MSTQQISIGTSIARPAGISRYLPTAGRILLGLVFFVFGLNGFLSFIPPQPMPSGAMAFAGGLFQSGYFFPMLKTIEVVAGALLLANVFAPLALAVLAPIVVNIFAFHAFLAPAGLPIAVLVLALEIYAAWTYRDAFRSMLRARVSPSAASAA